MRFAATLLPPLMMVHGSYNLQRLLYKVLIWFIKFGADVSASALLALGLAIALAFVFDDKRASGLGLPDGLVDHRRCNQLRLLMIRKFLCWLFGHRDDGHNDLLNRCPRCKRWLVRTSRLPHIAKKMGIHAPANPAGR